ncbi:MAG: MHYT domain-containing protein [Gemmatimonadales bacterium]|nr:MHYT domain-containing protein [Gemmatimonadales bacterium]
MQIWRFTDSSHPVGHSVAGHFDSALVVTSVLVAALAAFGALAVIDRIESTRSRTGQAGWLSLGTVVLGGGVWGMHFTGMLAYSLPFPAAYSVGWTLLSLIPALIGSALSLYLMSRSTAGTGRIQLAAVFLAAGVGAMHYTGMEAIRVAARLWYDPAAFLLSLVVALLLASLALQVRFRLLRHRLVSWVAGAALIGVAVSGMHYVAMAAVRFVPAAEPAEAQPWLPQSLLAGLIAGTGVLAVVVTMVATVADRRIREARRMAAEHDHRHREVLSSMGEGLLTIAADGRIESTNEAADRLFGVAGGTLVGTLATGLFSADSGPTGEPTNGVLRPGPAFARRADGRAVPVELFLHRFEGRGQIRTEVLIHDVTARRALELQLSQAQKLEAIGQLSAGIAHEINTPIQYVGDNTRFLQDAFRDLGEVIEPLVALKEAARAHPDLAPACARADQAAARADAAMLLTEVPLALEQTLDGVERVARIVRAMKDFSHPATEKTPIDLNRAIASTVTVATNEWKYVADLITDFDPALPPVPCVPGEINQVVLNLIVNAAHAIGDVDRPPGAKGTIRVVTRLESAHAVIAVSDTGTGIPAEIRNRVFDPFFTTKDVGKGSGQGLSLAHGVVVRKHGGAISFDTETGRGTTFVVRLPLGHQPDSIR